MRRHLRRIQNRGMRDAWEAAFGARARAPLDPGAHRGAHGRQTLGDPTRRGAHALEGPGHPAPRRLDAAAGTQKILSDQTHGHAADALAPTAGRRGPVAPTALRVQAAGVGRGGARAHAGGLRLPAAAGAEARSAQPAVGEGDGHSTILCVRPTTPWLYAPRYAARRCSRPCPPPHCSLRLARGPPPLGKQLGDVFHGVSPNPEQDIGQVLVGFTPARRQQATMVWRMALF